MAHREKPLPRVSRENKNRDTPFALDAKYLLRAIPLSGFASSTRR